MGSALQDRPATLTEAKIVTFGCRLNAYESEVIRAEARAAGLADAVIFNSCAVTAEAERQLRQAIRRARREHPGSEIIVTGCAAQIAPERFAAMAEVDRVLGNREKLSAAALGLKDGPAVAVSDLREKPLAAHAPISDFGERSRAFLEVQQGCDHACTFCIIPQGRGPSRSLPLGQILAQARRLLGHGIQELVLTGVDLTAYGADLPGRPSLGATVARLLALLPELPRLRLSSVDPQELDERLLQLFAEEPRLMPHLHLSLQAGDDLILKRMRRRHLRGDVLSLAERLRRLRPDIVLGADLIAGFPTESEAMFRNTLALVEEAEITWLHVFPYSERPGTPAARMPQVEKPLRKERAQRLRELGRRQEQRFLAAQVGRTQEVLLEKEGFGRSPHHAPVSLAGAAGTLRRARITGAAEGRLLGEAL